jgi:hypothetical protein
MSTLRCWETKSGEERFAVPWVFWKRFALLPDGQTILLEKNEPGRHRLEWRALSTGQILRIVELGGDVENQPLALTLSPDSTQVAVQKRPTEQSRQSTDKIETSIFDVKSGEHQGTIPVPEVRWSPDGQILAAPLESEMPYGTLGFWDIPPRKSPIWFVIGAALLLLPVILITRRLQALRAV